MLQQTMQYQKIKQSVVFYNALALTTLKDSFELSPFKEVAMSIFQPFFTIIRFEKKNITIQQQHLVPKIPPTQMIQEQSLL